MTLRPRLLTLIAVRVVVSTFLLGWAVLIQLSRPGSFPVDPFFFLIGLTYGLSVFYLATLRYAEKHGWLVDLQFGADALLVAAFVHLTGGITSYFSSLYVLPIIAASSVRFGRTAIQVATLSAVLYLALVTAQYVPHDYLPDLLLKVAPAADLPSLRFAQYTVFINLFGFLAVAWLSRSLSESLRSAGAKLEDASHQIEDLRAFNEYVIDSLLSGLISTDADCRIRTFNRAAAGITGVPAADAVGVDAAELLQMPPHLRPSLGALTETQSLRVDLIYKTGDGRLIDIGLTVTTIAFPDGRPGYLFVFQDVTTMKRLEREARLRQRLAAVGEMAAGIAHEIRNPLASMSGSIQLLREELPLSEEQAQLMDIVLRESERLNQTIGSFLAYARPQRAAVSRLDVRNVVEDAAALLRNSAEVRDAHRLDIDVPLKPVWYEADGNQVRQIIWNLATNGLRAMKDGGRLLLSVSEQRDSIGRLEVVLSVQDEGCGIPADEIDSIFQPFRSTFERGTGLGLATVHRIVTDYSGTIQVSSTVGSGTTMRVRLPGQHEVAEAAVSRPVAIRSVLA
ncbi:MAG TPA: ATP-binding protein [Vicinamibacterales bacterium]|nr:ATP-binding protein [Vicinamibacterales bacterium]